MLCRKKLVLSKCLNINTYISSNLVRTFGWIFEKLIKYKCLFENVRNFNVFGLFITKKKQREIKAIQQAILLFISYVCSSFVTGKHVHKKLFFHGMCQLRSNGVLHCLSSTHKGKKMLKWFKALCQIWGTDVYFYIVFRKKKLKCWIGEKRSQVDTPLSFLQMYIIVKMKWKKVHISVNKFKEYYICSPTRYTTPVMVQYLFTICLTARHVSDLQVHPQEHL